MLVIGSRTNVNATKAKIANRWNCKDLGKAKLFVGFQINSDQTAKALHIHQTLYSTKLTDRFRMQCCNSVQLPIPACAVLKQLSCDDQAKEL